MKKPYLFCASKRHHLNNPARKCGVKGSTQYLQASKRRHRDRLLMSESQSVKTLWLRNLIPPFRGMPDIASGQVCPVPRGEESRLGIPDPTLTCGVTEIRPLRGRNLIRHTYEIVNQLYLLHQYYVVNKCLFFHHG